MLPKIFKPFLWSYDFESLNKENNKKIVVENILNYGTHDATDALFELYGKDEVRSIFKTLELNSFNKKSFNFWGKVLN